MPPGAATSPWIIVSLHPGDWMVPCYITTPAMDLIAHGSRAAACVLLTNYQLI